MEQGMESLHAEQHVKWKQEFVTETPQFGAIRTWQKKKKKKALKILEESL